MPLLIKPRTLAYLAKAERRKVGASYIVTAMGLFDLARPDAERFESEQSLWLLAAKGVPKGSALDIGMPKPRAELLVAGFAQSQSPVSTMSVEWLVGPLHKRVVVFGHRYWQVAGAGLAATPPQPFTEIALSPERAFGGAGHPDNPSGLGFHALERMRAGELVALPNIEDPDQLVLTPDSRPTPVVMGPADLMSPKRRRYAGTYDQHWIKHVAPAMPDDVDPRLFLVAPEEQWFPGYLSGGEPYALRGFSPDGSELRGNLPSFRVRCFLAVRGEGEAQGELVEIAMCCDTLWLFAGARRGVLIYRGALPVDDIDANDVGEVMLAYERGTDEPRSFEHYHEVWQLRRDRENAFKFAFAEGQLAPPLSPEVVARRNAERAALARERLEKHKAGQRWIIERQLKKSGIPEALWPAMPEVEPDPDLVDFPVPTPEELETGEIDLAAVLDAAEALQDKMAKKAEELKGKTDKAAHALTALRQPGAGPETVDALFAALDQLDGTNPAAIVDEALAGVQVPTAPDAVDPNMLAGATEMLDQVKDWRRAVLEAAAPVEDEAAELEAARARFLDLPEGRPLAELRQSLGRAKMDFPELPAIAPPVEVSLPKRPSGAGGLDLEALLDGLDREPRVPEGTSEKIRGKLAEADAKLRQHLPNLPAGGSAIEAIAQLAKPAAGAAPLPDDPQEALRKAAARRDAALEQAQSSLDAQEEKLVDELARMRRSAPIAVYPKKPMSRRLARRFGDLILGELHSGRELAGRDLAGADLRGADLSGLNLEGALLEQADLSGARLAGARLANAALAGAVLDGADLSDADLTAANLNNCRARKADFSRSRLINLTAMEADFSAARFENAELSEVTVLKGVLDAAVFAGAKLGKLIFLQASLNRTVWDGADLERTQFVDLPIEEASFRGARLFRCAFVKVRAAKSDFSDADLTRSAFVGTADLAGAKFDRAIGAGSSFHGAKLDGASFAESAFDRASFGETDLSGTSFRLASLKGSIFSSAKLVGIDAVGANFLGAQLRRADLSGARLRGANLYATSLDHTKLLAADLNGANLDKTFLAVDTNAG